MLTSVYAFYVVISCLLTGWIARTLFLSGRPFLVQVLHGRREEAEALNQLLVVGFLLLNAGFIGITMREAVLVPDLKAGIELVSWKVGRTITILGLIHFGNLVGLCWLRDRWTMQK